MVANADFADAFRSNAHAEKTTDEPLIRVMALKLAKLMDKEDGLLFLRLCANCTQRIVDTEGDEKWKKPARGSM